MTELKLIAYTDFILPPTVVTHVDVARLVREVERVDNAMTASMVRNKAGAQEAPVLVLSEQLTHFLEVNALNMDDSKSRSDIVKQLRLLKDKVPVLNMTFSVTADVESLQKLAAWVRESVHPQAIIAVGIQPSLVAGVYLRTPNHVHDLSLRHMLDGRHDLLVNELETLRGSK